MLNYRLKYEVGLFPFDAAEHRKENRIIVSACLRAINAEHRPSDVQDVLILRRPWTAESSDAKRLFFF